LGYSTPNSLFESHISGEDLTLKPPSPISGAGCSAQLSRLAGEGIAYNAFHTRALCSPTRAAFLTGCNHHRDGAGQIAEFANDWDGLYRGLTRMARRDVRSGLC
jgi:arylsulfatase A-like enzyme